MHYRAAWVLEATRPLNWSMRPTPGPGRLKPDFPAPVPRETVEPGRARLLPDRWVVVGYHHQEQVFLVAGPPVTADLPAVPDLAATEVAPRSFRDLSDAQGLAWTHDLVAAESVGMAVRVPLGGWDLDDGIDLFAVGVCGGDADSCGAVADLLAAQHWTRGLDLLRRGTPTNNSDDVPAGYSATAPDLVALLDVVLAGGIPAKGPAQTSPTVGRRTSLARSTRAFSTPGPAFPARLPHWPTAPSPRRWTARSVWAAARSWTGCPTPQTASSSSPPR